MIRVRVQRLNTESEFVVQDWYRLIAWECDKGGAEVKAKLREMTEHGHTEVQKNRESVRATQWDEEGKVGDRQHLGWVHMMQPDASPGVGSRGGPRRSRHRETLHETGEGTPPTTAEPDDGGVASSREEG